MYNVASGPCSGKCPAIFTFWASLVAGFTFSLGWWLWIDANCTYSGLFHVNRIYQIPGAMSMAAWLLVNMLPLNVLTTPSFYYGTGGDDGCCCCARGPVKIYLLLGLMLAFGALIASCYILIEGFLMRIAERNQWPGWALFLQNSLIFISNIVFRFGRKRSDDF